MRPPGSGNQSKKTSWLPIFKHGLFGSLAGYVIFHPLTMVIYYLEGHGRKVSSTVLLNEVVAQILMSFTLHMLPMAIVFGVIGAVVGSVYGHHSETILKKNALLEEHERNLEKQLLLIEKQATLGTMASSIGHEINNLLMVITGYSQFLQADKNVSERFNEDMRNIAESSSALGKLSQSLLSLGKPESSSPEPVDLRKILQSVTETLVMCGILKRIQITERHSEEPLWVVCDPFILEQAIRNIEINASHAMNGRGELILEAGIHREKNLVFLKIEDSGPGIPEHLLQRIFDPFFTTKDEPKSTGLGLSIAKRIVEQSGGKITARNREDGGAEFEITLPAAEMNKRPA